ncbi:MAG: amino acid adenylation domain-containing protein [Candidatus Omnitrophota bacterium]
MTENNDVEIQETVLTGCEIAVIGMNGRFPGSRTIDEFWENLKHGNEGIRFFSREELEETGIGPELLENPSFVKAKGMLDDVDVFDSHFFNYTLRESDNMDPQLRVLHECAWSALEHAGCNPDTFDGSIGFYVGAGTHYYWISKVLNQVKNPSEILGMIGINEGFSISTQIAYRLNLRGPAMTIQTACSTSLVAIHTACQALLSGECDMALAGGVSIKLPVKNGYVYQEGMVLSRDGHNRSFDANASGTVSGDGVGIVVLKPAENAIDHHDRIYALIKGTAVNNDGNRKIGYAAPSVVGQAEVIRTTHKAAGIEPEQVTYVETHGTATALGDPVEIRALTQAFASTKKQFCRIGSVKSNIGHLDAASGVASFIKTVLALHHRMIPPSLHFKTPNPEIDFENSPFIVNTRLIPWERGEYPRCAGVSSFGIGGTNAHVVLEEYIGQPETEVQQNSQHAYLMTVSARTEAALERNTVNLMEYLENHPDVNFSNAVYTLQTGRKRFEYRRAWVCRDAQEAVNLFKAGNSKTVHTHHVSGETTPPVIFMFPGLGSQYPNMGYDLYCTIPLFRNTMDHCFGIVKSQTGHDLKSILYPIYSSNSSTASSASSSSSMAHIEVSQLVMFIFEVALARTLIHWGITPHAMIGYSFGEYTAACISGVFSIEDALTLIIQRGNLIKKTCAGGMLSVPLPIEQTNALLSLHPELCLAIDNGPSCIVSGPKTAIDAFERELKQQKYLCMRLQTETAIHSTLMDPIVKEFEATFRTIDRHAPQIPYVSNLTGRWITADEAADPAYWSAHLSKTVRFSAGILELVNEPGAIFLELGPGRDLCALIQRYMGDHQRAMNLIRPELKAVNDFSYLLDRMGRLWITGCAINWKNYYSDFGNEPTRIPLPTYAFERQAFVLETKSQVSPSQPKTEGSPSVSLYKRETCPDNYEAPRDAIEQTIADAFQRIFGIDRIGIHDDFFELGGDSLKVITLVTDIHQQANADIPMEEVFKRPTVGELADYVRQKTEIHTFSSISRVEEKEYYPLSPPQKRVFIMEQIEESLMIYSEPSAVWMDGPVNVSALKQGYRQLIERHESLRTGFFLVDGEPVQRIHPAHDLQFELYDDDFTDDFTDDFSHDSSSKLNDSREKIEAVVRELLQPFDLSRPPLWRSALIKVSENRYLFVNVLHHIICDDLSIGIFMMELSALYKGEALPALPVQYRDYTLWREQSAAEDPMLVKQEAFWLERFADADALPQLAMPLDYPRPEVRDFAGVHDMMTMDRELTQKVHELARVNKTTMFVTLLAIYNTLLYSYTQQEDMIVGIPITGRSHRDVQDAVGMFVNTLALRNFPKGNKPFESFLQEVRTSTLEAVSNQFYQFEDLVEKINIPRDMARNPLFDTMFILHTVNMENIQFPGIRLSHYEFDHPTCRFDISLNAAESSQGIGIALEYASSLFKKETMQKFMEDFFTVTRTVTDCPQVLLDDIHTHARERREEEKKEILYEFNQTFSTYCSDKTFKEKFEDQVEKTPDGIAVIGLGVRAFRETPLQITYRALNENANQLAHVLRTKGVGPETIVALLTGRTIDMLLSIIAILKAGGAYLPLGPEYPSDRIRYILQYTHAPILLRSTLEQERELQFDGEDNKYKPTIIDLTDPSAYLSEPSVNLVDSGHPQSLAYVIFTSGTTGTPKGVMIENRSIINFIESITTMIPFHEKSNLLSLTTVAFDIFGLESLLPLTRGSKVVIGTMEHQLNTAAAADILQKEHIDILQVTPSRLKLFLSDPAFAGHLSGLKHLLVGGEAFPEPLLEHARTLTRASITNLYGPTETTIWSCIRDVTEGPLHIGKPLANTRVYMIHMKGETIDLQPIGRAGELCISGHGVARGYFGDESLTREKFIENPFLLPDDPDKDGNRRLYRTGDLARWLPDGNIEFLGRIDHQLKVRGYRIEPGEIEARLLAFEPIIEAAVIPKKDEFGDMVLCAIVVASKDFSFHASVLREHLERDLPYYMIPSFFIPIEKMPLTPSGKIDRNALAKLDLTGETFSASVSTHTFVEPSTELEKTIAETWKRVLKLEQVGVNDNFLDIGGNSMKIIRAVTELKTVLQIDIPVVTMFRYPTIRALASFLEHKDGTTQKKDRSEIKSKGINRLEQRRQLRTR